MVILIDLIRIALHPLYIPWSKYVSSLDKRYV